MHRASAVVRLIALSLFVLLVAVACGGDDDDRDEPFELLVQPEFVQGALPGVEVSVLVAVTGVEGAAPVSISASYSGGSVEVSPREIAPGDVAEVTFLSDGVDDDTEAELTITAERGSVVRTATRALTVMPGVDDLEPTARELLGLFTTWIADHDPSLKIDAGTEFEGALVAPRLLVVSHYAFFNDDWEVGLAWHVTIPPNDWLDVYLRPRDSLVPTRAFRAPSWSTALGAGTAEFTEVDPPSEVTR